MLMDSGLFEPINRSSSRFDDTSLKQYKIKLNVDDVQSIIKENEDSSAAVGCSKPGVSLSSASVTVATLEAAATAVTPSEASVSAVFIMDKENNKNKK
jgi:hypothetical protein